MTSTTISLSTSVLDFALQADHDRLRVAEYGYRRHTFLHPVSRSALFAVYVSDQRYDVTNLTFEGLTSDTGAADVNHVIVHFHAPFMKIEHHITVYADTALVEMWQVIRNTSPAPVEITRVDSLSLDLPQDDYDLLYYTSEWGKEFEGVHQPLVGTTHLETRLGRSSKGQHPWFALTSFMRGVLSASVAWSGNWVMRFEPLDEDGYRVSAGLHDWCFSKTLLPQAAMESPPVVLVVGADLNAVSQQYAQVGRRHWYPRNTLSRLLPVEWNHWFCYEDTHITDAIFRANVDDAADMGMEICVLDAGWFGPSDDTHWYDYRGDWDVVNVRRFPHGIRPVSDYTHAKGMKFGLWCEIEALGVKAKLAETHPELVATRNGERLGYVCFGNPQTQEWAFQTLSRLISEYNCDWIKLDFNLDPGAGCNRTDHGHGPHDGLYEHYQGYYRTIERIRQAFPEVVLENCSSGGLRIDLGILRRTDMTFLSDPDWPVHDLQVFWGASTMLAPDACLHWSFCEWCSVHPNRPPQQTFDPRSPDLTQTHLDYYTRMSMLNVYGFSQRLPDLPEWVRERLIYHTDIYKNHVRRFVGEATLYRLTDQPKRDGGGDRWSAFQYTLPEETESLLFVFRLPGAEAVRNIRLCNLQPERIYQLVGFEGEADINMSGRDLMDTGIQIDNLPEEGSVLYHMF